jgi:hypothetical protein
LGPIVAQRLGDLGFNCQFIPNEQTLLWGKLCFLGTDCAGDVGIRHERWRDSGGHPMETEIDICDRRSLRRGERQRRGG